MSRDDDDRSARNDVDERHELRQLSEDLRVMLPGVQILFAFLLVLPFMSSLPERSGWDRTIYFVALLSAAAATAFFIAPSAQHRLQWREYSSEQVLQTGNRLAISGTTFLCISVTAVLLLVTKLLYGATWGAFVAAVAGASFVWLWYGLPLLHRSKSRQRPQQNRAPGTAPAGLDS